MTTLGVIGLGRIGAFHTETLAGLAGVDGLVVADERPDVVAAVAAKHGAKPADSVEELLTSGVDGVVVSAATPAHAELTLASVHRGLPTFCEKPIAATAAESARVADAIARSGVPVQVGYQRRFDAAFAAAKRAVDDGSLGLLHTVRSTTMDPAPPPMEYIKSSGGIFRDCAVHDFDVLRWITGQQAVEVYATGSVQGDPRFAEYGDVDTAAVVVTFDQGTRAHRCGTPTRTTTFPPDRHTTSSWTGSPTRSAPN
jgi:myo-inositol 2-dehydrogenase/D-chiro-inositol 1-dehydrogenase